MFDIKSETMIDEVLILQDFEACYAGNLLESTLLGDSVQEGPLQVVTPLDCIDIVANHVFSHEKVNWALLINLKFINTQYSGKK